MLGRNQDPFPHVDTFSACDVPTGTISLGMSCCLQTLDKNKKCQYKSEAMRKSMLINSLHDASNLPIKKILIDFVVTNEVLQEPN